MLTLHGQVSWNKPSLAFKYPNEMHYLQAMFFIQLTAYALKEHYLLQCAYLAHMLNKFFQTYTAYSSGFYILRSSSSVMVVASP